MNNAGINSPIPLGPPHIQYDQVLNPSQLEAVLTTDGPILVIAGAGSGKTRTLVYRVASLIENGTPPESILLLTFTCKAAREMLKRASLLLSESCKRVVGGTFHSIANQMLRKFSQKIGFPPWFTILDRSDTTDAIGLLKASLGIDEKDRRFPRKNTVAEIFGKSANKCLRLQEILEEEFPHFLDKSESLEELFRLYREYKSRHHLMDYDDLLIKWKSLLEEDAGIREMISRRFQYIMVDEYQDTNSLQADIVRLTACSHNNVMVVGDDSQSVYSFRGANFRNIMDFPVRFPGTRIIKLEENYRSTQPILSLANSLIAGAKEKYTKCLFTRRPGGIRARLVIVPDDNTQSRFICEKISTLQTEGVALSEIAVLFRASFHSFDLELAMARAGIPFVKIGGLKLIETAHIKDLLAHLRVIVNHADFLSWHRVLLLVNRIGHKSCQRVLEWLQGNEAVLSRLADCPISAAKEEGFVSLCRVLNEIKTLELAPQACVDKLLAYYEPILKRIYPDDYPKRLKDLEQLSALTNKYTSIGELLSDMVLEPPETNPAVVPGVNQADEILTLSTIHSAKGLEWHTVFVISLTEGRFPSRYSCDNEAALEEERRLMYVAVTRSKENLFLSCPASIYVPGDGFVPARPSRFLADIPSSMFEDTPPRNVPRNSKIKVERPSSGHIPEDDLNAKRETLMVGERVRHSIFGAGWVRELPGGEKVVVQFDRFGCKTLHLRYAPLSRIQG